MKKLAVLFAPAFLAATLVASPVLIGGYAHAEEKAMEAAPATPPGMMMGGHGKMMDTKLMMERHDMMQDSLKALRDTMAILRDLNHKPTPEQQKKLDEMIKRTDEIIKRHEDIMKEMQMRWKETPAK